MRLSIFSSREHRRFIVLLCAFTVFTVCGMGLLGMGSWHLRWLEPHLADLHRARKHHISTVFFGSSVNGHHAPDDEHPSASISSLVEDEIQEKMLVIAQGSFDGDRFLDYIRYAQQIEYQPTVLIVPVNLRTFSITMYRRPEYQFVREQLMLNHNPLWIQFLTVFGYQFSDWGQADYLQAPYYFDGIRRTIGENEVLFATDQLKLGFINHYEYDLTRQHPVLRALEELGKTSTRAGATVIYYLTPIDSETGEAIRGETFVRATTAASELLRQSLEPHGVWVDMLRDLPPSQFDYHGRPNEHLNERGRRHVASRLAGIIRKMEAKLQH